MSVLQCSYCAQNITDDSYLHCGRCGADVHIRCLRHSSTPGDLFGDVFFDFTCAKCMQLQYEGPSTSRGGDGVIAKEKFIRQRLPWLLVITLALYNLSIKSKGLSRHGYFHWRTHIASFIDKHWDYLFDPSVKRRKKWIGSISGALSHNSPKYFTSGQELFEETGWWKLTYAKKTPKHIYSIYEQYCIKRQQIRNDKRQVDDSCASDASSANEKDLKRLKRHESEEDFGATESCSRTLPYMGRKPKVAKQLNVLDDDLLNKPAAHNALAPPLAPQQAAHILSNSLEEPVLPFNTVQSSLMDFLAESLASDDLNMFNSLPNIATEPLVDGSGKNDMLPLLDSQNDNANFFDNPSLIKAGPMDLNGHLYSDFNTSAMLNEKLKSFYTTSPNENASINFNNYLQSLGHTGAGIGKRFDDENIFLQDNSIQANSEFSNDPDEDCTSTSSLLKATADNDDHGNNERQRSNDSEDESVADADYEDAEEFQPRIVQITNFQQLSADDNISKSILVSPLKTGKLIKQEINSDNEQADNEMKPRKNGVSTEDENSEQDDDDDEEEGDNESNAEDRVLSCRPSLFTKNPQRQWPWLVNGQYNEDDDDDDDNDDENNSKSLNAAANNTDLTMMSEYEEKEMLQKLRKIFSLEDKCSTIHIPAYIRRFYRKLCVREWKRERGKPLFNLGEFVDDNRKQFQKQVQNENSKIIDRYQMIALSSADVLRKSFYARIAGTFDYEMFESPYSQRILHPFIYRNRKCCPPYLTLMCELQFAVNDVPPTRATIDFCYVRPNHIAAVNALLQNLFWPGIDMSECLSYPDYSVVALYKKLVIGCGFLVPDVGFNEAYISFMGVRPGWQRSGIATFMLYHLIQTCMTKDITLHVSASNPAVVLYQKFGFKIEHIVQNFYDKYLPIDSKHSRHAFFLRLMR